MQVEQPAAVAGLGRFQFQGRPSAQECLAGDHALRGGAGDSRGEAAALLLYAGPRLAARDGTKHGVQGVALLSGHVGPPVGSGCEDGFLGIHLFEPNRIPRKMIPGKLLELV
ncbi:hypothetical protein GCM10010508_47970 [Streptomyces naganishii JCM 4654]|uniref:Uncharacterized protein n=1 Tax=Streptomyces naganishii JCM 4654 TaxID=1306179 RepID=A0A918Y8L8_9ACTN|nr:hypothetical protein GCM10010508_47970 [Streptomyces naganishii JCM 4654]